MTATIESTDGRSIDLNDTNADFIAVPRSEWEYLHDRIDDLKRELEDHKQYDGKRHAQANSRLTTVENDVDDMNVSTVEDPDPEAEIPDENPDEDGNGTSTDATAVTPMERLIQYSEDAAREHLTANEQRARFIAKDVVDYATTVPAGLVIDSSTIRKVVKAKEGDRPHTQTVARIMEFLADFGQDTVRTVKRHGKRRVVFDEDAARRYHTCCDGRHATEPPTVVMTPG